MVAFPEATAVMDKTEQTVALEHYGQFFDKSYRVGPDRRKNFDFMATLPDDLAAGIMPGDEFSLSGPIRESEAQPEVIIGYAEQVCMTVMEIRHLPNGHSILHLLPNVNEID